MEYFCLFGSLYICLALSTIPNIEPLFIETFIKAIIEEGVKFMITIVQGECGVFEVTPVLNDLPH